MQALHGCGGRRRVHAGVLAEPDRQVKACPHQINDTARQVIERTGILAGRRRAVDSTILADAVATQDTVTPLGSAVRRVGR